MYDAIIRPLLVGEGKVKINWTEIQNQMRMVKRVRVKKAWLDCF